MLPCQYSYEHQRQGVMDDAALYHRPINRPPPVDVKLLFSPSQSYYCVPYWFNGPTGSPWPQYLRAPGGGAICGVVVVVALVVHGGLHLKTAVRGFPGHAGGQAAPCDHRGLPGGAAQTLSGVLGPHGTLLLIDEGRQGVLESLPARLVHVCGGTQCDTEHACPMISVHVMNGQCRPQGSFMYQRMKNNKCHIFMGYAVSQRCIYVQTAQIRMVCSCEFNLKS